MATDLFGNEVRESPGRFKREIPLSRDLCIKVRQHVEDLKTAKHDSGGWQNHCKDTDDRLSVGGVLEIDRLWLGDAWRLGYLYGTGGWNRTCRRLLSHIHKSTRAQNP